MRIIFFKNCTVIVNCFVLYYENDKNVFSFSKKKKYFADKKLQIYCNQLGLYSIMGFIGKYKQTVYYLVL